ncbi:MAG TPA: CHAP domain-containing protein [Solirubrobacterales bacterium]|nr:CHAP domain-containing protein [Solirubrobacterales bacterium]
MSVGTTLSRIAEIETALVPPAPTTGGAEASAGSRFARVLGGTSTVGGASEAGMRAVQFARGEVGQAEQPPGSNDSPRIAQYREAVAGAGVGPWCADFVSWAARQAGAPLGDNGEGFQSVSAIWEWAQANGRAVPASSGPPQPGDLILWGGEHVGIVEAVLPDGSIRTIEGNSSDRVSQRTYGPDGGGATGYVRLG